MNLNQKIKGTGELLEYLQIEARSSVNQIPYLEEHETNIYIATYPKSGTTLLQQIVYSLITEGNYSFDEINDVAPYLEFCRRGCIDVSELTLTDPHLFKTHLVRKHTPQKGKFILCFRHPADVAVSYFHFLNGWFFDKDSVDINDFAQAVIIGDKYLSSYKANILSWYPYIHKSNYLALCYEHLIYNRRYYIQNISNFLNIKINQRMLDLAELHSSFEFMLKNKHKYSENSTKIKSGFVTHSEMHSLTPKVRRGKAFGYRDELSDECIQKFEIFWHEEIAPEIGLESYQALMNELQPESENCHV